MASNKQKIDAIVKVLGTRANEYDYSATALDDDDLVVVIRGIVGDEDRGY